MRTSKLIFIFVFLSISVLTTAKAFSAETENQKPKIAPHILGAYFKCQPYCKFVSFKMAGEAEDTSGQNKFAGLTLLNRSDNAFRAMFTLEELAAAEEAAIRNGTINASSDGRNSHDVDKGAPFEMFSTFKISLISSQTSTTGNTSLMSDLGGHQTDAALSMYLYPSTRSQFWKTTWRHLFYLDYERALSWSSPSGNSITYQNWDISYSPLAKAGTLLLGPLFVYRNFSYAFPKDQISGYGRSYTTVAAGLQLLWDHWKLRATTDINADISDTQGYRVAPISHTAYQTQLEYCTRRFQTPLFGLITSFCAGYRHETISEKSSPAPNILTVDKVNSNQTQDSFILGLEYNIDMVRTLQ